MIGVEYGDLTAIPLNDDTDVLKLPVNYKFTEEDKMVDKKGNLHCALCGTFVEADNESNADRYHYSCVRCMSCGYIPRKNGQNKTSPRRGFKLGY